MLKSKKITESKTIKKIEYIFSIDSSVGNAPTVTMTQAKENYRKQDHMHNKQNLYKLYNKEL